MEQPGPRRREHLQIDTPRRIEHGLLRPIRSVESFRLTGAEPLPISGLTEVGARTFAREARGFSCGTSANGGLGVLDHPCTIRPPDEQVGGAPTEQADEEQRATNGYRSDPGTHGVNLAHALRRGAALEEWIVASATISGAPTWSRGQTRRMDFAGFLAEDAPDPRFETWSDISRLPFTVRRLVDQPALVEASPSIATSRTSAGDITTATAGITYTLYRNPGDLADPANLADLDDDVRLAFDDVPPWPRPPWLVELSERVRYPHLWEAVHTSWYRDRSSRPSIADALIDHATYVLMNVYRAERGLEGLPGGPPRAPELSRKSVQKHQTLEVDGRSRMAVHLDTDPHVYAIGCYLDDHSLVTVVIPRDELPYVRLAVAQRSSSED